MHEKYQAAPALSRGNVEGIPYHLFPHFQRVSRGCKCTQGCKCSLSVINPPHPPLRTTILETNRLWCLLKSATSVPFPAAYAQLCLSFHPTPLPTSILQSFPVPAWRRSSEVVV